MARKFDAIVVGSGLGGLTAGALYARTGRRILVLERNDSFGGAATVYQHDGLAIEASLHEMDGLDEGDAKAPLLHSLGLDRNLPFVDVGHLYEVRGPLIGAPFALPVLSRYSAGRLRSRSTIEVQHSTESLTALYPRSLHWQSGSGLEQSVLDALVIPLRVIVHYEFGDGTTQRSLPYENHPLQAFLLDRAHEALRMGIEIRRSGR